MQSLIVTAFLGMFLEGRTKKSVFVMKNKRVALIIQLTLFKPKPAIARPTVEDFRSAFSNRKRALRIRENFAQKRMTI
jgi:hypothetical protein